jgi:hypothetical protein
MLLPTDIEIARRVLRAIEDHNHPSRADILALRLRAKPEIRLRSLEEIAKEFIKAESGVAKAPTRN